MSEKGYQPDGNCGCCAACGVICDDGQIPTLGVSYGSSMPEYEPTLFDEPCDDPGGWDCEDENPDSVAVCVPDPGTAELTGTDGGDVADLPEWVDTTGREPKTDTTFCMWTHTAVLPGPECRCHNTAGSCSWFYSCDLCECYWVDTPCVEPASNCYSMPTCFCQSFSTGCTTGCFIVGCDSSTVGCPGTCCAGLDPNNCGDSGTSSCPDEANYISGAKGCHYECADYTLGACSTSAVDLVVITYRKTDDTVILAAKLIWGRCVYTAYAELGTMPIACCDIMETLPFTYIEALNVLEEGNCCCSLPTVALTGVCD